jgi:ActR/RegA family two-component response regulator
VPIGNVLVVEDEQEWQGIYTRNAHPLHDGHLRTAKDLVEATEAIEEMAFAIAFVDIRLDENDDQNTDGLKVLELLRGSGDHTSAVMLTGHGTVGITRDALKEFDAYEALAKRDVEPQQIQELVVSGTEERNKLARVEDLEAPAVLRGRREVWDWDTEMLQATGGKGGADALYRHLDYLASPFLPLVYGADADRMRMDEPSRLALGVFWSRAVGAAVLIAIGQTEAMKGAMENGRLRDDVGHSTGSVLREREKGGLAGLVASLPSRERSSFS